MPFNSGVDMLFTQGKFIDHPTINIVPASFSRKLLPAWVWGAAPTSLFTPATTHHAPHCHFSRDAAVTHLHSLMVVFAPL